MKLLHTHFSPASCYFLPPRPKYLPQHPILKYPQPTFLTNIHAQTQHANLYFFSPNGSKREFSMFKYCIQ